MLYFLRVPSLKTFQVRSELFPHWKKDLHKNELSDQVDDSKKQPNRIYWILQYDWLVWIDFCCVFSSITMVFNDVHKFCD